MSDGTRLRCPGCHASVSILGDLIERHHVPGWESVDSVEYLQTERTPPGQQPRIDPVPLTIERRLECGYSGARVRVKR